MDQARYTRKVEAAKAALAAGFKSATSQQDAISTLSYAYDEVTSAIKSVLLAVPGADRGSAWDGLYFDLPYGLAQWRDKHAAAIVAAYPSLAPVCALVAELVTLRASIKAAPVVKPETKKAAAERKVDAIKEAVAAGVASPIAMAIAPLRAEAVAHAMDHATEVAAYAKERLAKVGFDIERAAPDAPRGSTKSERESANALRSHLIRFLTIPRGRVAYQWCEESAKSYIDSVVRQTEQDFDSFVTKLDGKVGAHIAAELITGATWSYSILLVTLADGTVQKWKTHRIVNCSILGKLFNQWPTRLMK